MKLASKTPKMIETDVLVVGSGGAGGEAIDYPRRDCGGGGCSVHPPELLWRRPAPHEQTGDFAKNQDFED